VGTEAALRVTEAAATIDELRRVAEIEIRARAARAKIAHLNITPRGKEIGV
tara:strand:+ start:188 stop:340 length:153 start_codon:yes stop_codon:yes gene_type:complete